MNLYEIKQEFEKAIEECVDIKIQGDNEFLSS